MNILDMAARYAEGLTLRQVAKLAGLPYSTVRDMLRRAGVKLRVSPVGSPIKFSAEDTDRMAVLYLDGKSLNQIAREFCCNNQTVRYHLRCRNISRRARVRPNIYDTEALAAAYQDGLTIVEVAQKFGCNRSTVMRQFRKVKLPSRRRGPRNIS